MGSAGGLQNCCTDGAQCARAIPCAGRHLVDGQPSRGSACETWQACLLHNTSACKQLDHMQFGYASWQNPVGWCKGASCESCTRHRSKCHTQLNGCIQSEHLLSHALTDISHFCWLDFGCDRQDSRYLLQGIPNSRSHQWCNSYYIVGTPHLRSPVLSVKSLALTQLAA